MLFIMFRLVAGLTGLRRLLTLWLRSEIGLIGLLWIVFGRLGLPRLKALHYNGVVAFELCLIALYGNGLVCEVSKPGCLGAV